MATELMAVIISCSQADINFCLTGEQLRGTSLIIHLKSIFCISFVPIVSTETKCIVSVFRALVYLTQLVLWCSVTEFKYREYKPELSPNDRGLFFIWQKESARGLEFMWCSSMNYKLTIDYGTISTVAIFVSTHITRVNVGRFFYPIQLYSNSWV